MAFNAKDNTSGQRVIRVWAQTVADFVQSPVTTVIASAYQITFRRSQISAPPRDENDDAQAAGPGARGRDSSKKKTSPLKMSGSRALLELKEQSKYKVLTARIIGRDPSVWFDSSIINRGSLDGVKLNMPVVTDGGLVGRVTAVSPLTSQVDLITRDKSGIGAVIGQIGESNALGVVTGTSKKDLLEMKYVPGRQMCRSARRFSRPVRTASFPPG